MGKGTITGEIGEGRYNVSIDTGSAAIASRVANLNAQIIKWTDEKVQADVFLADEIAVLPVILANINYLIGQYKAAILSGEGIEEALEEVNAAVVRHAKQNLAISKAGAPSAEFESLISQAESDVAFLNGLSVESAHSLWCADFTLEASGECGIVEVPGESKTMLIVPEALAPTSDDGQVVARPVQDSAQLFYNLALLPGWQKFKPTYRFGTLAGIDYEANTSSVTLETAYSSAQNLNVNQTGFLFDVPIEYMGCDAAAFDNGDQVVVKFTGQDWAAPKVVGFKSNPKPCGAYKLGFLLGFHESFGSPYTSGAPHGHTELDIVFVDGLWYRTYSTTYTPDTRNPWPPSHAVTIGGFYSNSIHLRFNVAWRQVNKNETYFEDFVTRSYRESSMGEYTVLNPVPPENPGTSYYTQCLTPNHIWGIATKTDQIRIEPGFDPYGYPIPYLGVGTTFEETIFWSQAQNIGYGNSYYPTGINFATCTGKVLDVYPSVPRTISVYDTETPDRVNQYQLESIGPPALMPNDQGVPNGYVRSNVSPIL